MTKDKTFVWGDGRKIVTKKIGRLNFGWEASNQVFYITDRTRGFQFPKKTALKFVKFVNKHI